MKTFGFPKLNHDTALFCVHTSTVSKLELEVMMEVPTRQQQMSQDADWLVEFSNEYFARGSQPKPGEACSLRLVLQRPEYFVAIDCLPDGTISSIATVEPGNVT